MTKKEFMRKFYEAHFDYDDENNVINLGHDMYSHMSEDPKDVMSFLIYSNKSKKTFKSITIFRQRQYAISRILVEHIRTEIYTLLYTAFLDFSNFYHMRISR